MDNTEMNTNIMPCTYINVQTSEGMFSTEMAVVIKLVDGKEVSLFADKGLLKENNGQWSLKVTPVKTNHKSQLVLLPIETFETSTRWAEVPIQA
jgi:hypothetical protein